MRKALITGITGQDGAYLAEFLLNKGYEVHGIKRRSSLFNTQRVDHLYHDLHESGKNFKLHFGDLTDSTNLIRIVQEVQPDEIYNLAAQSHVHVSFETPEYTANADAVGTLRLLEAIRILGLEKKTRFYQASTSELYGKAQEVPQNETTPFYPRSPYAVAKLYSYWITVNYREAYNIFASNGILFNHESPIRGETFVTRKITRAVAKIALGLQKNMFFGNLDAKRDWGHAKDYVEAMWLIVQYKQPDDFVVATGVSVSVREFIIRSFAEIGVSLKFEGKNMNEKGIISDIDTNKLCKITGESVFDNPFLKKGNVVVEVDKKYFRPTEVEELLGDASKAKKLLGWEPKYNLDDLVKEMVKEDLTIMQKNKFLQEGGFKFTNIFE